MTSVLIENLRNVARLQFTLPAPGVWILTAGNGAGKTTLLGCLRRIGNRNAFPIHFPSSALDDRLDDQSEAVITYTVGTESVAYAYAGERWVPRPRRNSSVLADFGYPEVIYVGATADRITPSPDDFRANRPNVARRDLITATNEIFETDKFSALRTVNVQPRGPARHAFMLRVHERGPKYHSEKQFSLGELCILKLVERILDCPDGSLLLIDELEMALHPRAQGQLYAFLKRMAQRKRLTVIVSTHSVSIIKSVSRRNIIYLERDSNNIVTPIFGCFPAYAIGNITLGEEHAPDVAICVEDESARSIVEPLVNLVSSDLYPEAARRPYVRIIPIGGYNETLKFIGHHGGLVGTRGYALLDADVRTETLPELNRRNNHVQLARFAALVDQISYLPWTPEVGVFEAISNNRGRYEILLRQKFNAPGINIPAATIVGMNGLAGSALRNYCKSQYDNLISALANSGACSFEVAQRYLGEVFATEYFAANRPAAMSLFSPMLNGRG